MKKILRACRGSSGAGTRLAFLESVSVDSFGKRVEGLEGLGRDDPGRILGVNAFGLGSGHDGKGGHGGNGHDLGE